jgi:hypothetical protein
METIVKMVFRKQWNKERDKYESITKGAMPAYPEKDLAWQKMKAEIDKEGESQGKKGCIEKMIRMANTMLSKLEKRMATLASSDDQEMKWCSETMVKMYGMLEQLLGIGRGEGDIGKVDDRKVQVDILEQMAEGVDALKDEARRKESMLAGVGEGVKID